MLVWTCCVAGISLEAILFDLKLKRIESSHSKLSGGLDLQCGHVSGAGEAHVLEFGLGNLGSQDDPFEFGGHVNDMEIDIK